MRPSSPCFTGLVFLSLTSCSVLIPLFNAKECPADFLEGCTQNTLTTCEAGFIHEEDCGALTCNPTTLDCEGCGDKNITAPEQCDDGNASDNDDCTNACAFNICGDGFILTGLEACDDGNQTPQDGCEDDCTITPPKSCGNNLVEGAEECDDGNSTDGDGCDSNCTDTSCGNGILTAGEACDDGNNASGDGCDSNCNAEASLLCAQATQIGEGDTQGNNSNGSDKFQVEIGDPDLECFPGDADGNEDLFRFTPPSDGRLFISVSSQLDLVLYARSDCLDPESELGCSDNDNNPEATDFPVTSGQTITIFVDGFGSGATQNDTGPYTLTVTLN